MFPLLECKKRGRMFGVKKSVWALMETLDLCFISIHVGYYVRDNIVERAVGEEKTRLRPGQSTNYTLFTMRQMSN